MTQRSIFSGRAPAVVVRAGKDVEVKGWDSDRILVDSSSRLGLQIKTAGERFEVQLGGSGQVLIPFMSSLKVYAGKHISIQDIHGAVSAVSGGDLTILRVDVVAQASAGGAMQIDCRALAGTQVKFNAGQDMRCRVREDEHFHYLVDDLGGLWQAVLGSGSVQLSLRAGGSVTLVTEQEVTGQPPLYLVGQIERPRPEGEPAA